MPDFVKVEVPQGQFIGWAPKPPQVVTIKVHSYDPTGGTDANKKICPQLIGELTEACESWREGGTTKKTLDVGELVTVNCGVHRLKAGVLAADPKPGDIVRMDFNDTYKTGDNTGKVIDVLIARATQTVKASDI